MVEKENFRFNQLYYLGTENFKQKDIKQIIEFGMPCQVCAFQTYIDLFLDK
jgi:hypothetical protein